MCWHLLVNNFWHLMFSLCYLPCFVTLFIQRRPICAWHVVRTLGGIALRRNSHHLSWKKKDSNLGFQKCMIKHLKNTCSLKMPIIVNDYLDNVSIQIVGETMFSWFFKEVISDCNSFNMLQVLFPNESVPIILVHMIRTIGPIDMEMLALGQ